MNWIIVFDAVNGTESVAAKNEVIEAITPIRVSMGAYGLVFGTFQMWPKIRIYIRTYSYGHMLLLGMPMPQQTTSNCWAQCLHPKKEMQNLHKHMPLKSEYNTALSNLTFVVTSLLFAFWYSEKL